MPAGLAELQQRLDAAAAEKDAAEGQLKHLAAKRDDLQETLKQRTAEMGCRSEGAAAAHS